MRRMLTTAALLFLLGSGGLADAQSMLERSPNLHGVWTLPTGQAAFVFAHRFELLDGADELRNIPTLTLGAGLPFGIAAGLDYTSNSEIARGSTGANEVEYWLKRAFIPTRELGFAALVGYNSVPGSLDGAIDARLGLGPVAAIRPSTP